MAEYLIQGNTLTNIANAIRTKRGSSSSIAVSNMATEISKISTGVELNFEVVGGTTQPSNPKENTIWINTSVNITSWLFGTTQPKNPTYGMVWIITGISSNSEFNALKNNKIQVYPLFAKQYNGSIWEDKTVLSYHGSNWVEWWNGELFNSGNQYEYITGGWINVNGNGLTAAIGTSIVYTVTGSSGRDATAYTSKIIDFSEFSTLKCSVNITSSTGYFYLGITQTNNLAAPTFIAKVSTAQYSTGSKTLSLSLSGITNGYIALWSDQTNATVPKVELVR